MPNRLSRYCEGVMEAGWLLALMVTPLFFNVYSSRVFEPDKIALLRSLALLVLAAWLIKLIQEGGPRFEYLPAERFKSLRGFFRLPLLLPVAALVAVYLIATFLSVSPSVSLFGSYQRLQGTFTTLSYVVMFAAVASQLRRRAQAERLLTVVILTSLPISLYGIIQHYRLDPLPWGGDTILRVTGNMGNAIFIAAYLIISCLIVLGRVAATFHAILTEDENFVRNMVRATGYVFILAINVVAIWFTGPSRGPFLGWIAGLFFFAVLLALYWGNRWQARNPKLSVYANTAALVFIAAALLGVMFLIVLNIPNGPLESLRQMPGVGRLGRVFETEGGTGRVRVLIWEGVVKLMTPHPPLEFPDGRPDPWNAIRPLVGYGPEALYVAFNRFYPPELAQIESRNASPDRSHNETFDALSFTGLLGLAVYLILFVAVFYFSLKWLGFVGTRQRRNVLLALILGGGLLSTVGFVGWQGPKFFGVGLPLGMLLGLVAFLTVYGLQSAVRGLRAAREPSPLEPSAIGETSAPQEPWRAIALISLFSAIVAHFGEIHFGIAIVSTRTHFWIFTGLLIVLGFVLSRNEHSATPAPMAQPSASRRRQRASQRSAASAEAQRSREFWGPVSISVGLMTAVLITLGYDFISNATHTQGAGRIVIEALTVRPSEAGPVPSYGILVLFLVTWLLGGALAYLEESHDFRRPNWTRGMAAALGISIAASGLGWMVLSNRLAAIAAATIDPQNLIAGVLASADRIAGVLTLYYFAVFVLMLFLAAVLPADWPTTTSARASISAPGLIGYTMLTLAAIFLSILLNLQVIQADMIYKTGLQFDEDGQPLVAVPLYEKVISLTPTQDYYYLFLGRAFLNATATLTDPAQRDELFTRAETKLKTARDLNPLNTDHTANLGRINRQWAALTDDPAIRTEKAVRADEYYQQALRLSPNHVGLWNEWAVLTFQLLSDGEAAQTKLDRSFQLDTKFEQTYQLQGDLDVWRANQATDPAEKQKYFDKAIADYLRGIEFANSRSASGINLHLGLASTYAATQQLQKAIDEYLIAAPNAGSIQWQVYRAVAELYRQMGNTSQALNYAQQALNVAPEGNKAEVQNWLDSLKAAP
jgi:tetratricopeptide (TPR) repeat protein